MDRKFGKKGKKKRKKPLRVVNPLGAVEEPVVVDPEVQLLAECNGGPHDGHRNITKRGRSLKHRGATRSF